MSENVECIRCKKQILRSDAYMERTTNRGMPNSDLDEWAYFGKECLNDADREEFNPSWLRKIS